MPLDLKEKPCVDCLKQFKPTSNVQKRCLPCKDIYNASKKKNKKETKTSGPVLIKKKKLPGFDDKSDDAMVLKMLVAIGLVTEEKMNAAREIVRQLQA